MELIAKASAARLVCAAVLAVCAGCRTAAPLHVWRSPKLHAAAGASLAVAKPAGPEEVAARLEQALFAAAAPHSELRLVSQRQLAERGAYRQASATESQPSDLEALETARAANVDLLLYGEVLRDPAEQRRRGRAGPVDTDGGAGDRLDQLRVAWRLFDVRTNQPLGGDAQKYAAPAPEGPSVLFATAADVEDERQLYREAAEGALALVAPHVAATEVALAHPWIGRGAAEVRAGNAYAAMGNWLAAERQWQSALDRNSRQHAAVHNLAYAALAREDYESARRLAREASRMAGRDLYEATAVWIESQWREAHRAIGVAPPAGGWYFAPPSEQPGPARSPPERLPGRA